MDKDKRGAARVNFERGVTVRILAIDGTWQRECEMLDVSETGALLRVLGSLAGLDLKEFNADPRPEWLPSFQGTWRAFHEQVFAFDKPIVCALEGFAINAGSAWALSSDFIVVGESAFLQVAEVRQGRPAPMNLAWLRLRYGDGIARRVALLGRKIPGAELARLGIALECVPDAEVLSTARDLAAELAAIPAQGLAITKSVLRTLDLPGGPNEWFQRTAEAVQGRSSDRAPLPSVKGQP